MLASSLREEAQATVSNKPGHREEREVSRKTIARGMPGDFRCDCGDYARVLFYFAREAAGALSARHSLRPLFSERQTNLQNSGEIAPRDRGVMKFFTSLRGAKRRSNPFFLWAARWIASLALAMTVSRRAPPLQPSSPAKAGDPVLQRRQ